MKLQRFGAADDLDDLARDLGLADAVHERRQFIDPLAGVLRGRIHGRHS